MHKAEVREKTMKMGLDTIITIIFKLRNSKHLRIHGTSYHLLEALFSIFTRFTFQIIWGIWISRSCRWKGKKNRPQFFSNRSGKMRFIFQIQTRFTFSNLNEVYFFKLSGQSEAIVVLFTDEKESRTCCNFLHNRFGKKQMK